MKKIVLSLMDGSSAVDKAYIITNIQDVSDMTEKPSMAIDLPGQAYSKSIQLQIEGQKSDLDISFKLHDDGTDKASGTVGSTSTNLISGSVQTVPEQMQWIKDYLFDAGATASWRLSDDDGIYGNISTPSAGAKVILNKVNMPTYSQASPSWRECRFTLVFGALE